MNFIVYTDFKSPYAYLAKDLIYALEDELGIYADWRHFTLDIPSYLGSATLDETGKVIESDRTEHQWRRIKYAYMDIRRYANLRSLTIRGTTKIWDTVPAATAFYFAKAQGRTVHRTFMDLVFEPFWKRALDIEDLGTLEAKLKEAGADTTGFKEYALGEGRTHHDTIRADAEAKGVFGVPTFFIDDEMFFGRESLALIRWKLMGSKGNPPTGAGIPFTPA